MVDLKIIDANLLKKDYAENKELYVSFNDAIDMQPALDQESLPAVQELKKKVEQLNIALKNMQNDFTDYVTNDICNPAPYCKNRCEKCTNSGWCEFKYCSGFSPKISCKENKEED